MRPVGKVNLIASFQAQSERAPESFDTATRVKGHVSIAYGYIVDLGGEFGLIAEVYEAQLTSNKCVERSGCSRLEFRPEQSG